MARGPCAEHGRRKMYAREAPAACQGEASASPPSRLRQLQEKGEAEAGVGASLKKSRIFSLTRRRPRRYHHTAKSEFPLLDLPVEVFFRTLRERSHEVLLQGVPMDFQLSTYYPIFLFLFLIVGLVV